MDEMQAAMNKAGVAFETIKETLDGFGEADHDDDMDTVGQVIAIHPKDSEIVKAIIEGEEYSDDVEVEIPTTNDPRGEIDPEEFEPLHADGDPEEDEDPEKEDEDMRGTKATYDGIFIIDNSEVSGRMVVGTYNHGDGSVEINKSMSAGDANQFDDIVENDQLYALLNEEAYDILMNSDELEDEGEVRLLSVRNNILNLDFVIRY
jgi:hypothetical protein